MSLQVQTNINKSINQSNLVNVALLLLSNLKTSRVLNNGSAVTLEKQSCTSKPKRLNSNSNVGCYVQYSVARLVVCGFALFLAASIFVTNKYFFSLSKSIAALCCPPDGDAPRMHMRGWKPSTTTKWED